MPARDIYHNIVKAALLKDNWKITHDPLILRYGERTAMVDLGAEKLIAAEKKGRKIAVEIKSFLGRSAMNELENALGQYTLYSHVLKKVYPEKTIYLAIDTKAYKGIFSEEIGKLIIESSDLKLIIFDVEREVIVEWID